MAATARRRWRRSLQLRVVTTTLLLSAVVMALLGYVLLEQVQSGLMAARVRSALAEASVGLATAEGIAGSDTRTPDAQTLLDALANTLGPQGNPTDTYALAIVGTDQDDGGRRVPRALDLASVPDALRDSLAPTVSGTQAYAFTRLRYADGSPSQPALAVGGFLSVPAGPSYHVYYLFPLTHEQQTLALVQRTVALTGLALVLLLAGIAALVTAQVVTPVRLAARTAERLAAGRLTERMTVRGEDDLARLATSFNRMAAALQRQIERLEELSRLQRRFVSDVSHELRTPLTTVRMAADLLHDARADFPPPVARAAELLADELNRFETLLVDLLEISRFDAGAAELEPEITDLGPLVARVVDGVAPLARHHGTPVYLRLPGQPCLAEVDPRRIERVLRNLVVNAVEHSEGRPVEVTLAGSGDTAGALADGAGAGADGAGEDRADADRADGVGAGRAHADRAAADRAAADRAAVDVVGADGVGADGVGADGVGADGVGADGVGADGAHADRTRPRTRSATGAVAVTVRDHGVGLRPGDAEQVFNRFWRADPARSRATGGTGLGLSIALEDTRLHNGWLQAWGKPGVGSVFRLTLPRRAGDPLRDSPLPLEPPASSDARLQRPGSRPPTGRTRGRGGAPETRPAPGGASGGTTEPSAPVGAAWKGRTPGGR